MIVGGRAASFSTYECFTIPNASCPVCGESVFFYQSPFGGRVFFDELGPPWPKHPCTDNATRAVSLRSASDPTPKKQPSWERAGWEPIRIQSSRLSGSWHLIPVEMLQSRLFFDALGETTLQVRGEIVALMKAWDKNGWGRISYVDLDGGRKVVDLRIYEKKRHSPFAQSVASAHRRRIEGD